ncbi:hypothetical protein LJ207_12090 [Halanaerobium sp. Z-7514]|uniref:HNH nuclease domain-containing protein n=1 Tax=Halanaerobium polyolivorans TaxID=2886943 RepID=A0AAW4X2Q0_9FIRM|nr:hypothetical protein [Halanaerobium polyolivorans]MCC3146052.1 hypothetical protein [Halanaerobium polyolivorans]
MYFDKYKNSKEGFKKFHKLAINMPRESFEDSNYTMVSQLAELLLEINDRLNQIEGKITYVDIYALFNTTIFKNKDNFNLIAKKEFFNDSLNYEESKVNYRNTNDGRLFRHIMELCKFFSLLNHDNKVQTSTCEEYLNIKSKGNFIRNKLISINIFKNPHCKNVRSVNKTMKKINKNNNMYYPAKSILQYLDFLERKASIFEISYLFGIIEPNCTTNNEFLERAKQLQYVFTNETFNHKIDFFNYMGWKDSNNIEYKIKASQNIDFKFKAFILYMDDINLINLNKNNEITLTDYSKEILLDSLPPEVYNLENYLNELESYKPEAFLEKVIKNNDTILKENLYQNDKFLELFSKKNYKKQDRKRSQLLVYLAKLANEFKCEVDNSLTFIDKNGDNYVEAHHILEFNRDKGPDVIENLIILNPYHHSLIHHGHHSEVEDFYRKLTRDKTITLERFKEMHDKYGCLREEHADILREKGILLRKEKEDLKKYIKSYKK